MKDLFGEAPVCAKEDALGFLIRWARRHRREPFSPEEVIAAAAVAGIAFDEQRQWGAVFLQAAREGYIRRADAWYARQFGNGTQARAWVGV